MGDYTEKIEKAVSDLELESISGLIGEALEGGVDPLEILRGMSAGMTKVGELFERGEYFLADLVLAGEVMKEGVKVLEPHLKPESMGAKGTVVICTVKGDIHDIGKNLVGTMLSSAGFKVIDLGVDVHEDRIVDAVREHDARGIGLSALLTSMVDSIGDVVKALERAELRDKVKIAIGGACTTEELARRMRVDALGREAVEAVKIFESFMAS